MKINCDGGRENNLIGDKATNKQMYFNNLKTNSETGKINNALAMLSFTMPFHVAPFPKRLGERTQYTRAAR